MWAYRLYACGSQCPKLIASTARPDGIWKKYSGVAKSCDRWRKSASTDVCHIERVQPKISTQADGRIQFGFFDRNSGCVGRSWISVERGDDGCGIDKRGVAQAFDYSLARRPRLFPIAVADSFGKRIHGVALWQAHIFHPPFGNGAQVVVISSCLATHTEPHRVAGCSVEAPEQRRAARREKLDLRPRYVAVNRVEFIDPRVLHIQPIHQCPEPDSLLRHQG